MDPVLEKGLKYSHLGLTMAIIIGAFFYGGIKLEGWLIPEPFGLLGGLMVGMIAGMGYFLLQINRLSEEIRKESPSDDAEP